MSADPYKHITIFNQPDCILPKSFFEGRFVPNFHPDSLDYEQWWDEQFRRLDEGFSDGGFSVSPAHYYHLNFKKINMLDVKAKRTVIDHPYFAYEDQQLFNDVHECRTDGKGLGIMLITGRGFGKSFDVTSIVEHEFINHPGSECIMSASTDPYVKLLWEKLDLGLNNLVPEIRPSLLEDTKNQKFSGYSVQDPVTKNFIKKGDFSIIRKVVYDNDPERTRGTRPDIHVWEEIGSWTGAASLIDCYKKTEASWWLGSFKKTFPIFIGTGGAMDTGGSIDAKIMFNSPEDYSLRAYDYEDRKIAKFVPAFRKFTEHYEKSGLSNEKTAKEFLDNRRERKKKTQDLYRQETSEFPYTPEEAFQTNGSGVFPNDILEERYVKIERTPVLKNLVQRGNLDWVLDGSKIIGVKWVPDPAGAEKAGPFEIAEHPEWTKPEFTPGRIPNLYISGCDSFDAAGEEGISKDKSPGSLFIYKRFYDISTTSRFFVAKITQRTEDATEFYWNTVKMNMYYNCKMLVEYTKIGIIQHYITKGYEHMLYERPRLDTTVIKESTSTNRYGVAMPIAVKRHIIFRHKAHVVEPGGIDQYYFQSQIRDMMSFSFEGHDKNKHDETMASSLALLGDDDMYKVVAKKETSKMHFPKFRRDSRGNLVFD